MQIHTSPWQQTDTFGKRSGRRQQSARPDSRQTGNDRFSSVLAAARKFWTSTHFCRKLCASENAVCYCRPVFTSKHWWWFWFYCNINNECRVGLEPNWHFGVQIIEAGISLSQTYWYLITCWQIYFIYFWVCLFLFLFMWGFFYYLFLLLILFLFFIFVTVNCIYFYLLYFCLIIIIIAIIITYMIHTDIWLNLDRYTKESAVW